LNWIKVSVIKVEIWVCGIIEEAVCGQVVLRVPQDNVILEMDVFAVFEIDAMVAGQHGLLVDNLAAMVVGAHAEVHVIIQVLSCQDAFTVGEPVTFFSKCTSFLLHQVFHVVRVDIGGVVVIDMDMPKHSI
jgi:hypothetical protein